ncbi:endo alpha-1,4 polygalactosaminidase [Arthrobacter sp. SLBN-53]|uniref:endo alpha-1,4 polygalactosaminidase n=1 Tax=Arthrobacter sp. SLBN-53 TaxID=2768412 RepID=UPI001169815D|nr:endo alpha-1,4 polygalactosaminidase [Arthrobacter sp. SLBN-53]TQK28405.1 glycosyl hydrolase family 114 [Arthrobacter sp. SLBN-53]
MGRFLAVSALAVSTLAVSTLAVGPPASAAPAALPPTTGGFDYQLGGASDAQGLAVVVRDSTAQPLAGAYNICYLNGFQTQPGSDWSGGLGSALLRDESNTPVTDADWPDEYILDPSTPAQRATILAALTPGLNRCADNGFDAIEIDNLDTFTRFPAIERAGALDLARSYIALAHGRGLAIGQKNAAELAGIGRGQLGFDFAVTEECAAYDECGAYTGPYGPHVLQIEYVDNLPAPFAAVCAAPDRAPLTILRDRDLTPPGAAGHVYQQCS